MVEKAIVKSFFILGAMLVLSGCQHTATEPPPEPTPVEEEEARNVAIPDAETVPEVTTEKIEEAPPKKVPKPKIKTSPPDVKPMPEEKEVKEKVVLPTVSPIECINQNSCGDPGEEVLRFGADYTLQFEFSPPEKQCWNACGIEPVCLTQKMEACFKAKKDPESGELAESDYAACTMSAITACPS